MISDNLATLYKPGDGGDAVRFRQGTVVAWNPATGQNTIDVAGSPLTDVPILNSGEAIALKAGHVVGLLAAGRSWFILGRVTPAGDPNFAAASVAFDSAASFASNFAISTTRQTKVTATLDAPAWADEAMVFLVVTASLMNPTSAADWCDCYAQINGTIGVAQGAGFAPQADTNLQAYGALTATALQLVTNPGPTILCEGTLQTFNANWPTDVQQRIGCTAMAIFRSTV